MDFQHQLQLMKEQAQAEAAAILRSAHEDAARLSQEAEAARLAQVASAARVAQETDAARLALAAAQKVLPPAACWSRAPAWVYTWCLPSEVHGCVHVWCLRGRCMPALKCDRAANLLSGWRWAVPALAGRATVRMAGTICSAVARAKSRGAYPAACGDVEGRTLWCHMPLCSVLCLLIPSSAAAAACLAPCSA
jgi:hypothetical protein